MAEGLMSSRVCSPLAIIGPAKSHPEVIVHAIAARSKSRALEYAEKHSIAVVHDSYQDVIDDPSITAIYIGLPISLHYDWALKAILAGKHVLLEKPACSNATEARALFQHPIMQVRGAPVLLEAFHHKFHPAWQTFLSLVHDGASQIKAVHCQSFMPAGMFAADDIRFMYHLSGGCMMDFATYCLSCVRDVLKSSSLRVKDVRFRKIDGQVTRQPSDHVRQVDEAVTAELETNSRDVSVSIAADMVKRFTFPSSPLSWVGAWPSFAWPKCEVQLADRVVEESQSAVKEAGTIHTIQQTITLWNLVFLNVWHSITVDRKHTVRRRTDSQSLVSSWSERSTIKAYCWPSGSTAEGQEWWSTYRYQLEEFVNKIKGRKGSGVWVEGADSVAQMELIDAIYVKGGLQVRPTSSMLA
ncbi:putative dimeric dihydrodiol dehydrogenase [Teratosphaeria nubilosa]|uniref:D-xylose 1-dehydrogenase (NADP(+), D-xylono-1,5-lactone-forming) n=1 Tax=Teratosphaeria nubilosa TaxID=161662 RepID=A0A6G1LLP2_9PEZI|nr:putative dimeric dihydrodiol dehydrogenase [Teratosphaeria nubilosa]